VATTEAAGGKTLMPAWDLSGIGRIAMVTDPQGASLYLMTPIPPPGSRGQGSDAFSVDRPQHIRWNELSASDPDGAVTFYSSLCGWDQQGDMDMGAMGKYRFLRHGGVTIGAVMPKAPDFPTSRWSYYIGVDDIDRAAAAVTAGGGRIVHGPIEIPGGEYSLHAIDPQQAAFGLVGARLC